MKVVIELSSLAEIKKILTLLKEFNIENFNIIEKDQTENKEFVTKGDKNIDPTDMFGIWADKPRSLEGIRKKGWQRSMR